MTFNSRDWTPQLLKEQPASAKCFIESIKQSYFHRLSRLRLLTILATSTTALAVTRTEIINFEIRVSRTLEPLTMFSVKISGNVVFCQDIPEALARHAT